ncbi:hypothetical protein KF840_01020 [bacterium]|nr:hypothetical protein [bacterium]
MADRGGNERGHALLTALIATALLLPLGAFAVMQARLDFLVQHYARAASETFAVAESGLEHALADLARDPRFERLLAGPDGRLGTADDGDYPFAQPPPAFFPAAPSRYDVRVAAQTAERVEIVARGYGALGSVRGVASAVQRAALPYLPGALATAAGAPDLQLGADWRIDGAAGVPPLAVASDQAADHLRRGLDADARSRIAAPAGTPDIGVAALPDLAALLAAAARRGDLRALGGEVSGALGEGVFLAPAGASLRDVVGGGILLVDGPLEIAGDFGFDGLVATTAGLTVAADATVRVAGAVLQGPRGGALALRGSGRIAFDERVAERLAARYPGLLPSRARVLAWRELADAEG